MTTKTCFKCRCEKPLGAFYRHSQMADGHLNKCIECTKKDVRVHRAVNLEKVRAYDRARASTQKRSEKNFFVSKAWRAEHPDRARAQSRVSYALRTGKINPLPCLVCGEKAVAHHPDYSRPLDVVWLCQPHHKQAHALVANVTVLNGAPG